MSTLRRHRFILNLFLTALVCLWQIGQPLLAANINWTAGSSANFNWETGSNWEGSIPTINDDLFFSSPFPNPGGLPNPGVLTLSALSAANSLTVGDNYIFNGGMLTLGEGPLHVGLGYMLNMNSQLGSTLLGGTNFLKTGGGAVRLANNNLYTGTTTISNGVVVISNQSALGTDTSTVMVTGSGVRGYPGGQLVLDGLAQSINFSRDLSLQGNGPIGDRSAALISVGDNELSGNVFSGVNLQNTRITSSNGRLTLSGSLDVGGTALTTLTSIGGASNTGGTASYAITGTLTGTGLLEKTGSGTLFFNPSDSSGFSGSLRISSSSANNQSTVRITSPDVLGTRVATTTSSVLDMNGGTLEVRMDTPSVLAGGAAAHVYLRTTSTMFADHSAGGSAVNGTVAFGQLAFEDNLTLTLNSRNGYGMSFGASPVVGSTAGDNNSAIANNLTGLLTFTGNFWSNTNNTASRTYTISGNGNTLINGNIVASSVAFNHNLTKTGTGILTITGTGSTLDGVVSVQGSLGITDFRSIGNNTESIVLGSTTTTGGNLIIGTSTAATVAGLTTSRPIVFNTTTTANAIYANQTGVNPVILNGAITKPNATSAPIVLGGTNTADNVINTAIPLVGTGGVNKTGPGTWVLAGANLYTGTTNIYNGTFKLKANAATSTILPSGNAITFVQSNQFSGGTLEFVGQAATNNIQALGALTNTNGSNTVKLTPGAGGTASMTFTSLGTVGAGSTLNVIAPAGGNNISFAGGVTAGNMQNAGIYYNGADFAYVDTGGVLRQPVYGTDTDFVTSSSILTAARSNEVTGSFTNAGAMTIDSLKISGSRTLDLAALLTIRTNATTNATGGILQNDGSGKITGTGVTTGGSGSLIVRVNNAMDILELNAPITSTTTGGFTKSGEGTLILSGTNAQTGTITINEGTVQLSGTGTLGAAAALTMRQNGTLDLNGVTPATVTNAFNSNGIVTNSSATAVTYTVGGANGTGTSFGIFKETNGVMNIVKTGTGAMTWNGLSNYTGSTTITGLLTVDVLADIGVDSGIGRGNAANNAGSLVITDSASGLIYAGTLRNGELTLGSTSASTNRLFTLTGNGVTLNSTVANTLNAVVWSNTGAIVHGTNMDRTFILTGTSQGENTFNPKITDSTGFLTSVTKTGTGIWKLGNAENTYSGPTTITQGILMATNGQGLSSNSNLVFDGGTLYSQGAFHRNIGTGPGEMRFATPAANTAQFSGGFMGGDSKLTVTWDGAQVWGASANFLDQRNGLILNGSQARAQGTTASIALSEVDIASDFSLGAAAGAAFSGSFTLAQNSAAVTLATGSTAGLVVGQSITGTNIPSGAYIVSINSATTFTMSANTANTTGIAGTYADGAVLANTLRTIRVDDNANTGAEFATISGNISGAAGTGIRKTGAGILRLLGNNSYDGETNVNQGTLVVTSLGHSTVAGNSSVGTTVNANLDSNSVTLGNGGTGAGILAYIGSGETSDRKIRINTTTGNTQIHADGSGPLILTNVTNTTSVGNKLLYLRGTNTAGNMITSQLADNGGTLGLVMDSAATWILTGNNSFTGVLTASGGAVGIGHDNALGSGTGLLTINNSSVFAYGGDRTINNPVTMSATSSTIATFIGEHSLTLNGAWSDPSTTSTGRFIRNNIVTGKTLTLNGEYIATVGTTSRSIGFDGSGDTILNGIFSTVSNVDFGVTYAGTGSLTLGGANTYSGKTTITSGTIRLGADNVIPEMGGIPAAYNGANNGLIFNPALGVTATLEMNGKTETVGSITAITLGTAFISNASSAAASLTLGALDFNSVFVGNITNSGTGALSITKIGAGSAAFSGGTYAHKGATTVTGGSLTLAGDVSNTPSISVTGTGSLLALTGGFSGSAGLTSLTVGGGATLSLQDGAGSLVSGLTTLSLGASGTGTASLNLNVGTGTTDTLTLLMGGTLTLGQTITFNLNDAGLDAGTTYTLLSLPGGGLDAFGHGNILAGATPGGFSSFTYDISDTYVRIMTGTLITGPSYFTGTTSTAWNGAANNWSSDVSGSPAAVSIPGQGTDVVFVADSYTGGALVTTLEQNFKINSLAFRQSANPVNTPASVAITPGATLTNRLEIAPELPADGINMAAGGPAAVTISANLKVGKDQTWTVADAGSALTLTGSLAGDGDVIKAGSGKVTVSAAADPTFAVPTLTVKAGAFEMTNLAALGTTVGGNVTAVTLDSGGAFYYNNATATTAIAPVPQNFTLNGGTLSTGGANHFYGGLINLSGDSFVNLRDNNSATLTATARNITLTNVLSGAGKLTVDGTQVVSTNLNQITGTLTLNNNNSLWTGGLEMRAGTVTVTNVNALGTGDILGSQFGRIIFATPGNTTFNLDQDITLNGPGAILELSADASGTPVADMTVNLNGVITVGSTSNINNALRINQATDNFSIIKINGGIVLGNNASISVIGSATRDLVIDTVGISETKTGSVLSINDDLGGWAQTNQTVAINVASTYTGGTILAGGRLRMGHVDAIGGGSLTVSASSILAATVDLSGTNALTNAVFANGTISMDGTSDLELAGLITINAVARTFAANSATGAKFILSGGITGAATADGQNVIFTGTPTGAGFVTGGITTTGTAGDIGVTSGNWTFSGVPVVVADDLFVTGATTVLNLASTGILSNPSAAGTSNLMYARGGGTINILANDINGVGNSNGMDGIGVADATTVGTGTLNINEYLLSSPLVNMGSTANGYIGLITGTSGTLIGTGTLTDHTTGFRFFRGTVSANLGGDTTIYKAGLGDVILSGDNTALTGVVNASTRIDAGNLILDYTASNTKKIPDNRGLDMRGGTLTINGHATQNTLMTVTSFTLASGGANTINVNHGGSQTATLSLAAITRAAAAGTLRINLSANGSVLTTSLNNSVTGLLGTGTAAQSTSAAYATMKDASGTWFATSVGGSVAGLVSTAKNDVNTWLNGDHVTDETTGFTGGSITNASLNSLRFDAATGSVVNIAANGQLGLVSGGILVTDQVTSGSPGILGGNLASGVAEFIVTQDSTRLFTISSDIRFTNAFTKTGNGDLLLSGNNSYTGATLVQGGTLQISGGNAIGDFSSVVMADDRVSTLELLSSETIGRLSGGSATTGLETLATVAIGSHTLTTGLLTGDVNYDGKLTGTGTIIKVGTSFQGFRNISDQFTGALIVNEGGIQFSGIGRLDASSITLNKGTAMDIANTGTTSSTTRILDTTPIIMNSVDAPLTGSGNGARVGLNIRNDQNNSRVETIGNLVFNSGASYLSGDANNTTNARVALAAANFVRDNNATVAVRARNLGTAAVNNVQFRISDTTNQTNFINGMVGGAGAAGTATLKIVPWAIGETHNNASLAVTNMGNSLVTYDSGLGFRPLNLSTEYATYATAGATNNTREVLTADLTGLAGRTLNALVLHKNTDAAGTLNVTGTGAAQTLAVTSGTLLFTQSTTAANGSLHGIGLSGFNGGITTAGSEYIVFVQNPSIAATTPLLTATIGSPLTSTADITKSGRGTLILTGTNTAGGGSRKTTINEGILEIAGLENIGGDTGELVFAGGTLRLGTGFTDDFATRTVTILQGGATWDTNGNDLSLVGSVGSGAGGLTKTGLGKLTLNTTATYLGTTTVNGGTLAVGVAQAIGSGGVVVTTGGTLEMAASATVSSLTLGLGTNTISGPGTLTVNGTATLNQGTIGAVLSGSMNLIKQTAAQTVDLTNATNTYTGYTHIQNGVLSVISLANAGTASSLGSPTGANATILMGMAATTGTLVISPTGTGGTTNRSFDLVGTTGGAIIDNDGTGALILNGGITSSTYGAKTLTLSGSSTGFTNLLAGAITTGQYGTVALTKAEAGAWELQGTNSYTGNTTVTGGTLIITGSVNNSPGTTTIAGAAGTNGLLRVGAGGSFSSTSFSVGTNATGIGSLLIDGGTVEATTTAVNTGISVGTAGYGALQINSGSFTANRVSLFNSATGTGVLRVNGGTLTSREYIILSNLRSEFTVTGGLVDHVNAVNNIALGYNLAGTSVMNMVGGMVNNTGRNVSYGQDSTSSATGILNLVGGTLITNAFTIGGSATGMINFNGGTLQAAIDSTAFIPQSNALKAYVYSGNAIFDTAGRNITVAAPLLAPTGEGVSGLTISGSGSGYFGAPYVEITGGGGIGATGYAVVDLEASSPTYGQVTSVVLTNPGIGYTSTPTISLIGGGGTGAVVSAAGLVENTSGGLIKNGTGILTLAGVNTYEGATVINGGVLSSGATLLPGTSSLTVGTPLGSASFNLYQDGVAADWNLAANANIILGSASTSGELGFQLGAPGTSDRIVISGTGTLTVNAGGGFISGVALSGFGVGTYTLINSATDIVGLEFLKLGNLPAGYRYSLDTSVANVVKLDVLSLATGTNLYWTGAVDNSWGGLNGATSNWSEQPGGTPDAGFSPGLVNTVHFSATNTPGTPVSTTLDSQVSIFGLKVNASAGTVTIAQGNNGSLTIGEGGIEIEAGAPALTTISAPVVLGAGQFWNVADAASTLAISGIISGTGNMTKIGSGTVLLSGANTFTGNVILNAGTLRVETAGTTGLGAGIAALVLNGGELQIANSTSRNLARPTTIAGNVTISTQRLTEGAGVTHTLGTLSIGSHTLNVTSAVATSGNQSLTFGVTTLTGSPVFNVVNSGLGATTVMTLSTLGESSPGFGFTKNGDGTLILSGGGSYTGEVILNAGILRTSFDGTTGLGIGNASLVINGGELQLFNSTARNYARPTAVRGDATITLNRNSIGTAVTHTLGTLAIGTQTLTVQSGTNPTSGNMGMTFGATTLSGSPSFVVTNNGLGATTVLTLGALNDGGAARTFTKQGNGTMTLATAAVSLVNGTDVNIEGGRLNSNNATALGGLADVTVSSGATFGVGASQTLGALNGAGDVVINAGLNLTVGSTNNNLNSTFSGAIATTTAGLTKAGTGVFALSGNNLYTGATAVNAGTLLVNNTAGSGTGGGNVSVASAATLGGMGRISGGVTLAAGAMLAPGSMDMNGSTLGQLTVGTLTANTTSSIFLQISAPTLSDPTNMALYEASENPSQVPLAWTNSYAAGVTLHDQVFVENMTASLVDGVINVNYVTGSASPAYGDVFHLFDWTTLNDDYTLNGTPSAFILPNLGDSLKWNTTLFNSHGIVFVGVIPEPGRMLLLFIGLMGLFFRRRRH